MIEIWTGDAESLVGRLPRDIDLMATDPPYGTGSTRGSEWFVGDDQSKVDRILSAMWAKIRPHRHGYVFGPGRDLHNSGRAELIWDKAYTTYGETWSKSHESIWFYPSVSVRAEYRREVAQTPEGDRDRRAPGTRPGRSISPGREAD